MADEFQGMLPGLDDPFENCAAVTPNDSADLPAATRGLFIGTAGDVKVTTVGGTTAIFPNHPVGYMRGRIARVHATGTAASDIVAIW